MHVEHDERQVLIGVSGVNDTVSNSALVILPVDNDTARGWVGVFYQQSTANGEIVSDIRNAHIEAGVDVGVQGLSVNAFSEINSDRERGIAKQLQVGGFGRYAFAVQQTDVAVGFGNFLENEEVRAELGLKDTDSNVSRWLLYASTEIFHVDLLARMTPKLDFSDVQVSLEPKMTFDLDKLGDNVSVVASAIIDIDSHPIVEDKHVATSYSLLLGATF